jgi:hypothetical protein
MHKVILLIPILQSSKQKQTTDVCDLIWLPATKLTRAKKHDFVYLLQCPLPRLEMFGMQGSGLEGGTRLRYCGIDTLFAPAGVDFIMSSMGLAASRHSVLKINNTIRINTFAALERVPLMQNNMFLANEKETLISIL